MRIIQDPDRDRGNTVKSLFKVMDILRCFSEDKPEWGVSELSRRLGLPKSTVHSILATLEKGRFVEKNPNNNCYRLGLRIFELGYVVRCSMGIREYAIPYLEDLQEKTQEIVYFTVPCEGEVLYIEAVYPSKRLVHYSIVGRKAPMHCTGVGKAILAYLPDEVVDEIIRIKGLTRYTENTITDALALKEELALTRQRGYAIDNREHDPGIKCVAVPIRDRWSGNAVGSISVSGPALHFSDERIPYYAELVMDTARQIGRKVTELPFSDTVILPARREDKA
ncbi:MAG TPA: IclR family transcriptional regulator [Firmicutes bacterium]|nr:IclR family transcriptional regulator [Bacillota bacterium]